MKIKCISRDEEQIEQINQTVENFLTEIEQEMQKILTKVAGGLSLFLVSPPIYISNLNICNTKHAAIYLDKDEKPCFCTIGYEGKS